jgi:DNA helicase IV
MTDSTSIEYEQSRVDAAYSLGEARCEKLSGAVQLANQKDAQTAFANNQLKHDQLRALLDDRTRLLLHGRIDFADGEAADDLRGETYYVGGVHLADEDLDPIVISWEAPLAEAFYEPTRFRGGHAVERRLTFDGRDRKLEDVSIQTFIEGRPAPGNADPLLAALESRTSGQLQQVVATIQAEQYELMGRPLDRTLVIQGGPGTGKTIVGLHRISVLLYRNRGELTEGDVLVVGPSTVFMRYIERVLPELGRSAVRQQSIDRIALHEVEIRGGDDLDARRVKGLGEMTTVIRNYLRSRIVTPTEDLSFGPQATVPQAELGRILDEVRDDDRPYNIRRDQVRTRLHEALGGARGSDRSVTHRERGAAIAARFPTEFENALDRFIQTRSPREVVHDLLTGPRLLAAAAQGVLSPAEQAVLRRRADRLAEHPWSRDDLPLLDEAAFQLDGVSGLGQRFLHIVVDEAQDLSPMQLRMLARRSVGAMTILGDLAQGTSPWAPKRWEDHLRSGGIRTGDVAHLTTSYRTTQPLLEFANRILPAIDVAITPAESIVTQADPPAVMKFEDRPDLAEQLVDVIESIQLHGVLENNIGIIAEEELLRSVSAWLDEVQIDHTWAARSLSEPVTLVPADDAKGLEFDHVVVLEPEKLYRSDPVMGPRLLFVAMTRARETLTLFHGERLPALLLSEPPSTKPVSSPTGSTTEASETTPGPVVQQPVGAPVEPALPVTRSHAAGLGGTLPRWACYVQSDGATLRVAVEGDQASVERVPLSGGGAPVIVAAGRVVHANGKIAWALTHHDGDVVALVTTEEATAASSAVVGQVAGAGPLED